MRAIASNKRFTNIVLISQLESKRIDEALREKEYMSIMKELDQFEQNKI